MLFKLLKMLKTLSEQLKSKQEYIRKQEKVEQIPESKSVLH